jgi:hypothetical protein
MPVLTMAPLHPGLFPAILLNHFDQFLDLHYLFTIYAVERSMSVAHAKHGSAAGRCSKANVISGPLALEGRNTTVKVIGERRAKTLSHPSQLESQRFRSSLFSISFEPRMSAFQGELHQKNLICP